MSSPDTAGTPDPTPQPSATEAVAAGRLALRDGRWAEARAAFEAALMQHESAEALAGLGEALWWLCEARPSVRHRERAFVLLRRSGDLTAAGRMAVDLTISYVVNLGNEPAAHGWLARAERVTEALEPNPLQGWLWLLRGFLSGHSDEARRLLELAIEFARTSADADLELVALADLGLAMVVAGEVDDGLALLDEAMAATLAGEYHRLDTVVFASCDMLAGCSLAGDLYRAAQWCRVADEFMIRYGSPFLYARCRVHYGSVLVEKGHWERADAELRAALGMAEDAGPGPRAEAAARLAELRVRRAGSKRQKCCWPRSTARPASRCRPRPCAWHEARPARRSRSWSGTGPALATGTSSWRQHRGYWWTRTWQSGISIQPRPRPTS